MNFVADFCELRVFLVLGCRVSSSGTNIFYFGLGIFLALL